MSLAPMINERGDTLIEVAVAMMITAIIASSVFSVAVTTKRDTGKGLRKLIASQAERQLSEQLKDFVTADNSQSLISGPTNQGAAGTPSWNWNNSATYTDTVNGYALSNGSHVITGILPPWFSGAPYNATITYWVNNNSGSTQCGFVGNGNCQPQVNITVAWTEP